MTERTQGPWRVRAVHTARAYIKAGKDTNVAEVGRLSDAALVAAAPDLLEALESLVSQDEANRPDGRTLLDCDLAYAAIAKARHGVNGGK